MGTRVERRQYMELNLSVYDVMNYHFTDKKENGRFSTLKWTNEAVNLENKRFIEIP